MSGFNRTNSATGNNTPSGRTFIDAEGARWVVYEQSFADYDRRSGMSLIFSSESVVRRVRNYPANWHELSDEELLALSWNA